jgi:hypothetical protein
MSSSFVSPNQSDLATQVETLTQQVSTLQNLVNALQNQQSNPSSSLPQVTKTSATTSIPSVSQVTVLSQKPGPTGIQVTVGFTEPSAMNSSQISSYNVWLQLGSNTPSVIASVEQSPCMFTVSNVTAAVTGIIGVQTVMKDGATVDFSQCPTTTLNLAIVPGNVQYFSNSGLAVNASQVYFLGSPITVASAGTYLVLAAVQAGNHGTTSGTLTCAVFQNGSPVSGNYWIVFVGPNGSANTIASNIGFYLVTANAGDTIQVGMQSNVAQTYDFGTRILLLKQFAS